MTSNDPIKISKTEFFILQLLLREGSDLYGLEMIRKSNNKLKRGTIYTTLTRMEDKGIIKSKKEKYIQPGLTAKRRMYTISGTGVTASQYFQSQILDIIGGVSYG